jgi:co-chaperonin GroES (HSP10)
LNCKLRTASGGISKLKLQKKVFVKQTKASDKKTNGLRQKGKASERKEKASVKQTGMNYQSMLRTVKPQKVFACGKAKTGENN